MKFRECGELLNGLSELCKNGDVIWERDMVSEENEMLGLKETVVQMAKANGVRWEMVRACVEEG